MLFFEGLIPEGWLLGIASKSWKINKNDKMGLLLTCCQNCIGAVSIYTVIKRLIQAMIFIQNVA
ncbi:HipA N-terminal domain-containing protein [Lacinutrix sp. Bg11-31]|uniref:HipA N-terminal domain-containing protein n=1 Tax=Lacinutrix sp. Bg11-31 TaxID=2057808 RepID=UPI003510439D